MNRNNDLVCCDMNISEEARNILKGIPVEILVIPNRAKNALTADGIENALRAIEIIKSGFDGMSGIGAKTISDSVESIDDLLVKIENIEPDLIPNVLDPRESYFEHANGNVLQVLSPVMDLYFEKKGGKYTERNKDILRKRFNLGNEGEYTLEDIGTYYDLTRERVRQVEAKTIAELDLLLLGKLKTKNWRLDSRLTDRYLDLRNKLSEKDFILSTIELNSFLNDEFRCSLDSGEFRVFMEVLGYVELPSYIDGFRGNIKSCWCLSDRFDRKEIESIFQALDVVFDFADPIKKFDLIVKAKRKAKRKITNESIHIALKSCEEIEVDDDLISIKFNYLRSAADKAYRLLSSKNTPLHYSELCKEINLLEQSLSKTSMPIRQTNLKNQMGADERFKPIGRSGEWGLSKWSNFENVTIIQAIESVLHKSGSPLSFSEISKGVKEIRPDASKRSFIVYLTSEPTKFTKVGEDLYALASWQMTPFKRRKIEKVSNEIFYDVAKAILEQRNPIPFPAFIEKMSNKTGLKEPSIRARINDSPIIRTRETNKQYKEVYCDDLNFSLEESGLVKTLLRDRVQNEIRSILYEQPNTPITKGDLYKLVNIEVPCQRPTFYQYLDKASDIKQYKKGNSYFAVYEHFEEGSKIDINLGEYNLDSTILAHLLRPISMLDIENHCCPVNFAV
jgi:DNA-directed RNA polymerase delta subunit